MVENPNDFFTKKHKKLSFIATVSSAFSWILLIYYFVRLVNNLILYIETTRANGMQGWFRNMRLGMGIETAITVSGILNPAFQGLVFFLLLRGLTSGLNMIIETDLNYREYKEEETNV